MAGGRKLEFDKTQALEAAMRVFWQKGYLGASLSDLTDSMGISKPSMYATFGNKEALFLSATQHYVAYYATPHIRFLQAPDTPLKTRLRHYLASIIKAQFETSNPTGCYISLCVTESASDYMPEHAKALIREVSDFSRNLLTDLFEQDDEAQRRGLNQHARQHALSLVTLTHGTAAMARAGDDCNDILPIIDGVLKGLASWD